MLKIVLRLWIKLVNKFERVGFSMLHFTWKVFSQTGSIDTYLLYKELEKEMEETPEAEDDELASFDMPMT